jgi:hypothetical protein
MTLARSFGSTLSLLLSLLMLVPRTGLAEELPASSSAAASDPGVVLTPAPSGLPGTSELEPLRLGDDVGARQPERPRTPRGLRILAETGAGLLTSGGLGAAGFLVSNQLCQMGMFGPTGGSWSCLGEVVIGSFLGVGLGLPLGVFWGGEVTGGNGKLYGPLLGMLAGVAAGVLVSVALDTYSGFFLLALPFMLGGSIVGYELTTSTAPVPRAVAALPVASSRPHLQPVLSFSSRGALLGLAGSF